MASPDPDRILRVRATHDELASLAAEPGWETLLRIFAEEKAKHTKALGQLILRRETQEITQREIDYTAGLFDGIDLVLKTPANARREFERLLKRAQQHGVIVTPTEGVT